MKKHFIFFLIIFCFINLDAQETMEASKEATIQTGKIAITDQQVTINGATIPLKAHAGTMQLRDENNEPIALFGFTAYFKDGATSDRPIMFAYNGGPGSSSFWLHMGVLGPKRIVVNDPISTPAAPYLMENNEYSILDVADLVMIDPVGTGLSVPIGEASFADFWGVDQDIRSISLFITQFLIEHDRLNSPKFLLGESYGTFRNAGVMDRLLSQGIAMNGVIMVSAVFDLRTLIFPPGDDMPYIVHFPTYAATAWYHDKITDKPENLDTFLDNVRQFTEEEYMPALFKGDQLSEVERSSMAQRLSDFTGVSQDYWLKADLRVTNGEFFAELMRDEGSTVGRLDSRFTGLAQDGIAQNGAYDPQSLAISPAYITRFLDYLHNDLKVDKSLMYSITAGRREGFKWDWKHQGNSRWGTQAAINTGIDMARAMTRDPNMKVLIV
ncbi:MAG: carboxypeptidase, partial [Flavobacteriaceae bacterium]|nr:carboxypeptidase [Flavobacteriaceae bacterium]